MKVTWNEKACCHSGKCVQTLPQVFKIENGQFVIEPKNAKEEEILQVIATCPSKALHSE